MKKSRIAFCPCDPNNLKYFDMMQSSLRKFHSEEELPLMIVNNPNPKDVDFWYKACPAIADELLKEYEVVIKLDADQVITGDLSHIWEGDFDIAVVQNSNPREMQKYPVSVWDIPPIAYVNCGMVVMKNPGFVTHWLALCNSYQFYNYQYREQDLLNILVYYCGYNVRFLDQESEFHGLASKGYWPQIELKGGKLILPKNDEFPTDEDKEIVCIHAAGGNDPDKMKFKLHFKDEVVKRLEELIK